MNMFKKNGGFTLVELIVVIAILAILAGVAVPAYSGYITKAQDAAVVSELGAVLTAAQAANAASGGSVSEIHIDASGKIYIGAEQDANKVADNSDFDTFYGSHTFKGALSGTYAEGADWYAATNKWTPGE